MRQIVSLLLFLMSANLTLGVLPQCFADNSENQVTISDVKPESENPAPNQKWTGNERSEDVSKYGTITPIQAPIEYAGKGLDMFVSGIGKALTAVITLPLKALPHRSSQNAGGQNAEEKDKKN